ncbi:FecR domain-containing protein [Candidatus Pelagibacter bacterium]|nr:FecR domain-containing protein [Candidatus Pelagibacter bacterium]MDA8841255.1 FecR domain-containing protein [Candidatus Pelagibacter bacterium]
MKKLTVFILILFNFNLFANAEQIIGSIGLTVGTVKNQKNEILKAGDPVYFGDEIIVEEQSKSQVLLLDETVLTLGQKSSITIDEFVYDPNTENGKISTSIAAGSVKVLSGKISQGNPEDLVVKTPAGSIGTRGTEFQTVVDDDGDSKVLLIGPGENNTLGLRPGAVEVFNDLGSVTLDSPFAYTEFGINQIPTPPVTISNEQLQEFQSFLAARTQGLDQESVQEAIKEGLFDDNQIGGNEIIGQIVTDALNLSDGGLTFDQIAILLGTSVEQLLGEDATEEFENESAENQIIMANAEGGDGFAYVLRYGGTNLGPTTGGDFYGITSGTYTYTANDVNMAATTGTGSGTFSATSVVNFATNIVTNTFSGSVILGSKDEVSFSYTTDDPSELESAAADNTDQVLIAEYFSINSSTGATAVDSNGSSFTQTDYEVDDSQYIAASETSYYNVEMNGSSNSPTASVGTLALDISNYTTDGTTSVTNNINGQRAGIMPTRN